MCVARCVWFHVVSGRVARDYGLCAFDGFAPILYLPPWGPTGRSKEVLPIFMASVWLLAPVERLYFWIPKRFMRGRSKRWMRVRSHQRFDQKNHPQFVTVTNLVARRETSNPFRISGNFSRCQPESHHINPRPLCYVRTPSTQKSLHRLSEQQLHQPPRLHNILVNLHTMHAAGLTTKFFCDMEFVQYCPPRYLHTVSQSHLKGTPMFKWWIVYKILEPFGLQYGMIHSTTWLDTLIRVTHRSFEKSETPTQTSALSMYVFG